MKKKIIINYYKFYKKSIIKTSKIGQILQQIKVKLEKNIVENIKIISKNIKKLLKLYMATKKRKFASFKKKYKNKKKILYKK